MKDNAKKDTPDGNILMLRRRVLLLDDDVELCDLLRNVIKGYGYEPTVVHRGVEGVREIMSRDYDAIVCDMMMPTMPGDMFYLAVQRLKPHLCRRFIFITGHQNNPKVECFLRVAAGAVIYKPMSTEALRSKIAEIIAETDASVKDICDAIESELRLEAAERKMGKTYARPRTLHVGGVARRLIVSMHKRMNG